MRLISSFDTEKQAYTLYALLLKEGIQNTYEPFQDETTHQKRYRLWVYDENDFEISLEWAERYRNHPDEQMFQNLQAPLISSLPPSQGSTDNGLDSLEPIPPLQKNRFSFSLTHWIIAICVFLFMWIDIQETQLTAAKGPVAAQISFTPVQQALLFDDPSDFQRQTDLFLDAHDLKPYKEVKDLPPRILADLRRLEQVPIWRGFYNQWVTARKAKGEALATPPLFEKIRQDQWWRLFTPCLMHRDFLHILFNLAWIWILGRQIDERLRPWRVIPLILIIGIVSNVAQYLMSGPFFLGISGVVVGLAGFIWMRQRIAPWEGYPLSKATFLFLIIFVLSMLALEWITLGIEFFSAVSVMPMIANTAHVVGGLCGMFLGKFSFFGRRLK